MIKFIRYIFYTLFVKPLVYICLGLNVRQAENLPKSGPAILICNHNSHLDTFVLMSLFPMDLMMKISPVAAADYFLKNKIVSWFVLNIINIVPIYRSVSKSSNSAFFDKIEERLKDNGILILYPEGSRGKPEQLEKLKSGIFHIAKKYPDIPIIPCFTHGLGIVLPKNEVLLVPAICDIMIEKPVEFVDDREKYMENLNNIFNGMRDKVVKK